VTEIVAPEGWTCPAPLRHHDRVVLGHGGGGRLSADLIEHLLLPAYGSAAAADLPDAAVVHAATDRLAFSTDAYVVRPLYFPGGSIADLAVNGTINDLAMRGARPSALSVSLILEEGLPLATLARVADDLGRAARAAGVDVVTGDTKVVGKGQADEVFIITTGVGEIPDGVDIGPLRATPGDLVVVSGPIGAHGVAVLSEREGLTFGTDLVSDTAPLHEMVAAMLAVAGDDLHVLRDPTRGGLAASLCEIAATARVGVEIDERAVPVPDQVAAACSMLGLDPMHVANEGRLVAMVAPARAQAVVDAMRSLADGADACVIGQVTDDPRARVVVRTPLGVARIVDRPMGEQLPRIC